MLTTSSDIACLYVYDGLDNPVGLITDFSTNAVTGTFDPYGVGTLTGSGNGASQNPYSFHSGIQDRASGLVKFGIRWYNPVTGAWTQQDTLDAPLDPSNGNRYVFTGGDAINGVDPTGESCATASASYLGIEAVVAGGAVGILAEVLGDTAEAGASDGASINYSNVISLSLTTGGAIAGAPFAGEAVRDECDPITSYLVTHGPLV